MPQSVVSSVDLDGFAICSGIFGSREIDVLAHRLSARELSRSRAGARHLMHDPTIAAFAHEARLLNLASDALHSRAVPFRATLFDKSPHSNWLVVWHQDTALPVCERRDELGWGPWSVKAGVTYAHAPASALSHIVALRVHLDDSTEQNGPLRVLPRTHTFGVLSDEATHELSVKIAAVDCCVASGGVLIMRPLLVHASSKSQSEVPRRVLHLEYADSLDISENLRLSIA